MTDLQDMRARMRDTRSAAPTVSSGGQGFRIPFGIVAVAAVAIGFAIVTVTPKFYSVQRTATLPAFHETKARSGGDEPAAAPASAVDMTPIKADYAGKSPEEAASLADAVCAQRVAAARAQPKLRSHDAGGSKIAAENVRLSCFLAEGPARFCIPSHRRKATADIINYFKGLDYANASVGVMRNAVARPMGPPSGQAMPAGNVRLVPDPQVVAEIEGLLRAGYIAQGNRDDILTNVPHPYKERFAGIVGNRVPCPEKPWWQVWR